VVSVEQITNHVLVDFTVHLRAHGGPKGALSAASIHAYLRPINQFLKWSREQGSTVNARAKLATLERRLLETLSRAELRRMEDHRATEPHARRLRVRAHTALLWREAPAHPASGGGPSPPG
jgi:site-specific recombinase XerD